MKRVGNSKSPGLDGLFYYQIVRLLCLFILILTDFLQLLLDRISRTVITMLKNKHGGNELDYYRRITLLNTRLKFCAKILTARFQLVAENLLRHYAFDSYHHK